LAKSSKSIRDDLQVNPAAQLSSMPSGVSETISGYAHDARKAAMASTNMIPRAIPTSLTLCFDTLRAAGLLSSFSLPQ
jgi:hypothetical protein